MRVVRDNVLHALEQSCSPGRQSVRRLSRLFLAFVLADVGEICDASHEVRAAHCPVGPLATHVLVVPCKMRVKVLLESHVPNEAKPADTALKLDALVYLCYREYIKSIYIISKLNLLLVAVVAQSRRDQGPLSRRLSQVLQCLL